MRRVKARYVVALGVSLAAVVWMITSLSANVDYWKPVAAAVRDRSADTGKHLRVGGLVVPGTIAGREFVLSDGAATMRVRLGDPQASETLRGCTPLVVAGRWQGSVLVADELTRRHGSTYSSKPRRTLVDDTPISACQPGTS